MKKIAGALVAAAFLCCFCKASVAGMSALEDTEMAQVQGQVGITFDLSILAKDGYFAFEDSDGFDQTATAKACGTLGDFWANGGNTSTPVVGTDWSLDIGTDSSNVSYLILKIGELSSGAGSGWGFNSFKIGTLPDTGTNIGQIALTEIDMEGSVIRIAPIP